MSRLQDGLDQIAFARGYTASILDAVPDADWFRMPAEGVTHVAWQVGHIAFAQYRLLLERVRGVRPDDEALISADFLRAFGRDSVVNPDPAAYPSAAAIRAVFDAVYAKVMADLPAVPDAALEGPPESPHRICTTKLQCLRWASHHETIHVGQIALLRRLFGRPPVW